ncbi:transcriptional regulator [Carnobacterium divergens]|uniref:helix-turn-helix transcriptional regulator n=1 Tax=Carnobacterium divergens TaxID=2748 RepID=UPI001072071C|nr:YafY family protein [Carnobacterium divergens]TFJ44356.1 transcriptional regulator [Carnobacterium divergens]TFJ52327.1 transcriptional regulator [Carnobacterium divergens]TFJ57493.1 transcriptional regulator [Carnobacterium divergens]TFJ65919.1 transcriptional regulator [Carnobacterium divergens]TFJ74224.1 transcriptional regulator [Carnobacterium divergens]
MKVERLISIIMVLLDKKRISAQTLADRFEVSLRTIYRDIDAINMAGIPVRSISGVGGGIEIMPNYKIDRKTFSTNDLSAILMGLSNISNMMQSKELSNALAKVKSFIPANSAKDIELKANQIYIDLSPWMGGRDAQNYLEMIKKALHEKNNLSFDYADRYGNKTTRSVEPYQLVMKNSHWYVHGYCLKRNDFRLFRLFRMSNLQLEDTFFTPRDFEKPQLNFTNEVATMIETIQIRIHQSVMDKVLDFCAYEQFAPDGDEHYIVDFPFIENDYYYTILFSFGNKCECLEPQHIRTEIKRRVNELATMYEN